MNNIAYRTISINGINIFYREAGPVDAPVLLLLHGFPSSSHMFRNLIPALADTYHVIAPDLPGFGFSESPARTEFNYTFDNLSNVVEEFTMQMHLKKYSLYLFDYGAPVGLRLAVKHPDQVSSIITQNGNAYLEGLSDAWKPIQQYWREPNQQNRDKLRGLLTVETTKWQYTEGVTDLALIAPESYAVDSHLLARPGNDEIQLDLFLDYASNIELYPTFQEYFRKYQPPLLAVWGNKDPFFLRQGAECFKRDLAESNIIFLETGHFALETHLDEIVMAMRDFLSSLNSL